MEHSKKIIVGGSLIVACLIFFLLAIATSVEGEGGTPYQVLENKQNILEAQKNAIEAHVSLEKAREVVKAAVAAENQAQAIVDGYSKTARTAREVICSLGKEHCIKENLDPFNTNVNIDEYITSFQ